MIRTIFKSPIKRPETRFNLVFQLSLVTLIGFALMRVVLLIRAWPFIDDISSDLLYIFGQGLVYDIALSVIFISLLSFSSLFCPING